MKETRIKGKNLILYHMLLCGGITSWEANKEYGIQRLSARIYDLKKDGLIITSETIYARNRFGWPVRYSKYKLVGDPQAKRDLLKALERYLKERGVKL